MKREVAPLEALVSPSAAGAFPSTRYQGSKAKLVDWIWEHIASLDFATCLDSFGGTGVVAHRLKREGKQVTYNDLLRFNYYAGLALIENSATCLAPEEVDWLLRRHSEIAYPCFIQNTFPGIYFTDEENAWIDQTITNIRCLTDPYKFALAFFALCQACAIKRPYNLFHRKNLYLRLANIERSFGNKVSWDRPFEASFRSFVGQANRAVIDNGKRNRAVNYDAAAVPGDYDLVYIDPPYISGRGIAVDYLAFYHFLEGLTMYDEWEERIDRRSKHRRMLPQSSEWTDKGRIHAAFARLFERYRKSIIIVSYRSDGIPTVSELAQLLRQFKDEVRTERRGRYRYALSTNGASEEILLIGT